MLPQPHPPMTSQAAFCNYVQGLKLFMDTWDGRATRAHDGPQVNQFGTNGNINTQGASNCFSSALSTPRDPGFGSYLEPGIRPLVMQCIDSLQCITYSSCEGHPSTEDSELRLRHVGIVPRDHDEYIMLQLVLRRFAAAANIATADASRVIVWVRDVELDSDSLPPRPALDIVFAPVHGLDPREYFKHLAISHDEFYGQVRAGVTTLAKSHRQARRRGPESAEMNDCKSPLGEIISGVRQFYDMGLAWHYGEPHTFNSTDGLAHQALHLHALNFGLWHQEDAVRLPGASEREVACRKYAIDDLNSRRNTAIEDIDSSLLDRLPANETGLLHTDTPGAIVDRLSVLSLRIFHTHRGGQAPGIRARLDVLLEQHDDLLDGLVSYLARVARGQARFKLYKQFKSDHQRNYCSLLGTRDRGSADD
jgi:uncharacterized protein DUF4254